MYMFFVTTWLFLPNKNDSIVLRYDWQFRNVCDVFEGWRLIYALSNWRVGKINDKDQTNLGPG